MHRLAAFSSALPVPQYKCWKGRGFGGEEGGEKEVREVGKEKNKSEKKGKVEWRM